MERSERMLAGALLVLGLNSLYLAARADASLLYFGERRPARRPRPRRRRGPRPAGPPPLGGARRRLAGGGRRLRARGGPRRRAALHRRHAPLPAAPLRARRARRPRRAAGPGRRPAPRPARSGRRRARERHRRRPARRRRSGRARGRRPLPAPPPHRESRPASRHHGGGGPGAAGPVLPVLRRRRTSAAPVPSNFFMKSQDCARCHKDIYDQWNSLGAPLRVVQQPVVPQVDRVHAGRRGHEAVEVVRRLPRPRGRLRRQVRHADHGADRHPGGAGRARLHVLPLDRARQEHDGPGRLHDRVPAAPRPRGERQPGSSARATTTC